jgi:hypothetical protein
MPYMLLIVESPGQRAVRSVEDGHAVYQRMLDYSQTLQSKGVLLGVNSLRSEALRLRKRPGEPSVVDGPFTEAREFIGGYFLLDCQTQQQARAYAEQCPAAEWATIEIREVGPCYA